MAFGTIFSTAALILSFTRFHASLTLGAVESTSTQWLFDSTSRMLSWSPLAYFHLVPFLQRVLSTWESSKEITEWSLFPKGAWHCMSSISVSASVKTRSRMLGSSDSLHLVANWTCWCQKQSRTNSVNECSLLFSLSGVQFKDQSFFGELKSAAITLSVKFVCDTALRVFIKDCCSWVSEFQWR